MTAKRRMLDVHSCGLLLVSGLAMGCGAARDLCVPSESVLSFFSKGDCKLTNAAFFQGHEWLTAFGNRDLPDDDRFTDDELHTIAEGNRRVDWPKELLVHLENSVLAYTNALTEYTDRPENQRMHFLLTDRNDSRNAATEAHGWIRQRTSEAVRVWFDDRKRALTLMGQATHTIQDSVSEAHAERDPEHPEQPWCIVRVKAYIERAPGFDTPEISFHGGTGGDTVGHATTQDSIYRPGRECHSPSTAEQVDECLSDTARHAALVTRNYLAAVRRVLNAQDATDDVASLVDQELDAFIAENLELCP